MASYLLSIIITEVDSTSDFSAAEKLIAATVEKLNKMKNCMLLNSTNLFHAQQSELVLHSIRAMYDRKKARHSKLQKSNEYSHLRGTLTTDLSEVIAGATFRSVANVHIMDSLGNMSLTPNHVTINFGTVLLGEDKVLRTLYINNKSSTILTTTLSPLRGQGGSAFNVISAEHVTVPGNYSIGIDIVLKKQTEPTNIMADFDIVISNISKSVHVSLCALVQKPDLEFLVRAIDFGSVVAAPEERHKKKLVVHSKLPLLLKAQVQSSGAQALLEVIINILL